ncbi:MAG: 50S ribosomal protein L13 [Pseudomonadales bacterium]|nr:50S ribosomal protein L13 [Candidatus Woesebacteria bacterium]MCB9801734.1 50S ribosomal protein L13 [Pseudomonadales bacterium]
MKTYMQKSGTVQRVWHEIDAMDVVLGRLATRAARLLIGKHKPTYTPHIDAGDYVVVTNAASVALTGRKETDKVYYRHSGYPGGLRSQTLGELREKNPTEIIRKAVYNMLPDNRLRSERMARLKIFAGSDHPHSTHFSSKKPSDTSTKA